MSTDSVIPIWTREDAAILAKLAATHPTHPARVGMRPKRLRRLLMLAGLGAVIAGAFIGTGVAHADSMGYLNALESHGITVYSPGDEVAAGYRICNELNIATGDVVAARVYNTFVDVTTMRQAEIMVIDSVENLCPWQDHRGQASAPSNGISPVVES